MWTAITLRLDYDLPGWRETIHAFGQVSAILNRQSGKAFTDVEIFRGFVLSILSKRTPWSKIERIQSELTEVFNGYSIDYYAALTDDDIEQRIYPWFTERRAGSQTRKKDLKLLVAAAQKLMMWGADAGSVDQYLSSFVQQCGSPLKAAERISKPGEYKLPGFGIALAAEALRNIGYDLVKPDTHLLRFAGVSGLVNFDQWKDMSGYSSPVPTSAQSLNCVTEVSKFAIANGVLPTFADNAIWLLCAEPGSGLHATNEQIRRIVTAPETFSCDETAKLSDLM